MPIPIVSDISGLFLKQIGETINYTPYATNVPTSWACGGLPAGVSINTTTGVISGTPTTPGLSACSLTATNASGTSAAVNFPFKIIASPLDEEGFVELNFDLQTGQITNPSITEGPQIYGKNGNLIPVALGLVRATALRTIALTNIKAVLRDNYDAPPVVLFDGAPGAPLDALRPRYRFILDLSAGAVLDQISEHEQDELPFEFAAKIEIELTYDITAIGGVTEMIRGSVSFAQHLVKSLAAQ